MNIFVDAMTLLQVTVLLKECQDIQVRCGVSQVYADNSLASSLDIDGINAGGSTTECPVCQFT